MKLNKNDLQQLIIEISNIIVGSHFNHIIQFSQRIFAFDVSNEINSHFLINLDNKNPHISIDQYEFIASSNDSNVITASLKKDLNGAVIKSFEQFNDDKIVKIETARTNAFYKKETRYLYIELIPYHPNLILTDENDNIIAAFRQSDLTSPRPLQRRIKYLPPEKIVNKNSGNEIDSSFDYETYCKSIKETRKLYILQRRKEKSQDVMDYLNKKIKNLNNKIEKLNKEKVLANRNLIFKEIADFLSYNRNEFIGKKSFVFNNETYPLNPQKTINQIIENYYKQYKKSKTALLKVDEYINLAQKEKSYYQSLLETINDLDESEINDLRLELGMIKQKPKNRNKNANSKIPYYVIDYKNSKILFGKNNVQNDYLTFEIAQKGNPWLHIKDEHGSHLIIKVKDKASDDAILFAAECIILLAKRDDGDVILTERQKIRKGNFPGEVKLTNYVTIHINKIRKESREYFGKAIKKND